MYFLKFSTLAEAQIAVSYLSRELAHVLTETGPIRFRVDVAPNGVLAICAHLETETQERTFCEAMDLVVSDLVGGMPARVTALRGEAVFSFDRAALPEAVAEGPGATPEPDSRSPDATDTPAAMAGS